MQRFDPDGGQCTGPGTKSRPAFVPPHEAGGQCARDTNIEGNVTPVDFAQKSLNLLIGLILWGLSNFAIGGAGRDRAGASRFYRPEFIATERSFVLCVRSGSIAVGPLLVHLAVCLRHTLHVHRVIQQAVLAAAFAILSSSCSAFGATAWQQAVQAAARTAPAARIVVLDINTGRLLAAYRLSAAAHTLAAPGSTLKPLVLYSLILTQRWDPDQRIACNRRLMIAGRSLACSHPQAPPFNAREALTWSCNSYFAAVARTLAPGELASILRPTGLLDVTGLAANEAAAEFREPRNVDDEQLALLGVEGIRVSPLELAEAYRWLALQMAAHPNAPATQVVRAGLLDSASFGMAGEASLGGLSVAGKTGTAEGTESARTHGWFAGLAPAAHPQVVVVVFESAGRGADAAHMAGEILAHAPGEERQ